MIYVDLKKRKIMIREREEGKRRKKERKDKYWDVKRSLIPLSQIPILYIIISNGY